MSNGSRQSSSGINTDTGGNDNLVRDGQETFSYKQFYRFLYVQYVSLELRTGQ